MTPISNTIAILEQATGVVIPSYFSADTDPLLGYALLAILPRCLSAKSQSRAKFA